MTASIVTDRPTIARPTTAAPAQRMPVGARFPRRSAVPVAVPDPSPTRPASALLSPVGRRFPRRTALDTVLYPMSTSTAPSTTPPAFPPVGARFPRGPRRTR